MILLNETFESKNSLKLLDNIDLNKNGISEQDRLDLIGQALLDKRLSGADSKLYMFLLNFENKGYRQEDLANILSLTRVSVNKSISKLLAFNYISVQKGRRAVIEYKITPLNEAGIPKLDLESVKSLYQLELKRSEYFEKDDFNLEEEWNNFNILNLLNVSFLDSKEVESILESKEYKFLLFTVACKDSRIVDFKDKYLESFIQFYDKFVFSLDELFFELYYLLNRDELILYKDDRMNPLCSYNIQGIMRLCDIANYSDKIIENKFKSDILKKIKDLRKSIELNELLHETSIVTSIISSIEINLSKERNDSLYLYYNKYSFTQSIFIVCLCGYKDVLEEKLKISIDKFLKIIDINLFNELNLLGLI